MMAENYEDMAKDIVKYLWSELAQIRAEQKELREELDALRYELKRNRVDDSIIKIERGLGDRNSVVGWSPLLDFARNCIYDICYRREKAKFDSSTPVLLINDNQEFLDCLNDVLKYPPHCLTKYDLANFKLVSRVEEITEDYPVVAVFTRNNEIEEYVKYCSKFGLLLDFGEDPSCHAIEFTN